MKSFKLKIESLNKSADAQKFANELQKINGVHRVDLNSSKNLLRVIARPEIELKDLQTIAVVDGLNLSVLEVKSAPIANGPTCDSCVSTIPRPSFWQLIGLFALVIILGSIFSKLGLLKSNVLIGSSLSLGAVFMMGLVAASSSCVALAGGLMLSSTAKFNEICGSLSKAARMRPVILFTIGRALGYGLFGGLIGLLGKALTPSPLVTGLITIIAALYMLVMGLDILGLAPLWLKKITPRLPKNLGNTILNAQNKNSSFTPFLLGSATFFLPCGFTQALQLYALTTASFLTSAAILFTFALGTTPSLLALGWASSSLKGTLGQWFFRFSGALVVMLGLWNIQNGFAITGYPLSLPKFALSSNIKVEADKPNVIFDGKRQIVKMSIDSRGYTPNNFTLQVGIPTRWEIDGTNAAGCLTILQAPQLGIQELIKHGPNVIEFTPTKTGQFAFSCSMGMYRGEIKIVRGI